MSRIHSLRHLRYVLGDLTLQELADRLGSISYQRIGAIEKGARCSLGFLDQLKALLDCSLDDARLLATGTMDQERVEDLARGYHTPMSGGASDDAEKKAGDAAESIPPDSASHKSGDASQEGSLSTGPDQQDGARTSSKALGPGTVCGGIRGERKEAGSADSGVAASA